MGIGWIHPPVWPIKWAEPSPREVWHGPDLVAPLWPLRWEEPPKRHYGPYRGTMVMRPENRDFYDPRHYTYKPCPNGPHETEHCALCSKTGQLYNYGCRCDPCRDAHRDRCYRRKAERARLLEADPTVVNHGSASTYRNWQCRCPACTAAHSMMCKIQARDRAERKKAG